MASERQSGYGPEFLQQMVNRKFRHPATSNQVQFQSLPPAEQRKIYQQWSARQRQQPKPQAQPSGQAAPSQKQIVEPPSRGKKAPAKQPKKPGLLRRLKEKVLGPKVHKPSPEEQSAPWKERTKELKSEKELDEAIRQLQEGGGAKKPPGPPPGRRQAALTFLKEARELLGKKAEAPEGHKWKGPFPKGWTAESRKKFWNSLTSGAPKHKVTECIKKMKGKVGDPGAFCAALADREIPGWRTEAAKERRKKKALEELRKIAATLNQPLRTRPDYGERRGDEDDEEPKHSKLPGVDSLPMEEDPKVASES